MKKIYPESGSIFIPNVKVVTHEACGIEYYVCDIPVYDLLNPPKHDKFIVEALPDEKGVTAYLYTKDCKNIPRNPYYDDIVSNCRIIINGPCTIIMYKGEKTIVRTQEGEKKDKEKGLLMCLLKHLVSSSEYTDIIRPCHDTPKIEKAAVKAVLTHMLGKKTLDKYLARGMEA